MAFRIFALAGNSSTTVGTGDISIGPALPAPFRSLASVLADGDTFPYCIRDLVNFESGLATWHSASGGTFTRTRVDQSSIGNVVINFSSGTRNVFCDYGVAMFLYGPNNLSELTSAATARTNLGLGSAAVLPGGFSGANTLLELDAAGKIPAVDGSQLTTLPAILPAPATTAMLFYQAAAPSGWTRVTTIDDTLVSITNNSGTGGGGPHAGGTVDAGTGGWDNSYGLTVSGHTLTAAEAGVATTAVSVASGANNEAQIIGASAHTHGITSASTLRPPRAYVSLCTKN